MSKKPGSSFADIVAAAVAKSGEPEGSTKSAEGKPPALTADEIATLAHETAIAVDAEREAKSKAAELRAALLEAMIAGQITSVEVIGRKPIKRRITNERQTSLKAFKELLGEEVGQALWDSLPAKPRISIDIPIPIVDEP